MFVNQQVIGVDQSDVGIGVEDVNGFCEGGGGEEVIAIDPPQVGKGGLGDRGFEGEGDSLMGSSDDANARVALGVGLGDIEGMISGTVVPD